MTSSNHLVRGNKFFSKLEVPERKTHFPSSIWPETLQCSKIQKYIYTPRKLTWNPKMEVWKMIFLFNWVIFRFHVNFQGCNPEKKYTPNIRLAKRSTKTCKKTCFHAKNRGQYPIRGQYLLIFFGSFWPMRFSVWFQSGFVFPKLFLVKFLTFQTLVVLAAYYSLFEIYECRTALGDVALNVA